MHHNSVVFRASATGWSACRHWLARGVVLVVLGLLTQTVAVAQNGQVRLVAEDGTDSGDCTEDPCATIQYAIDVADPGDVISVAEGEYEEQVLVNKDLTLAGEPGATLLGPEQVDAFTIAESGSPWQPVLFAYGGTLAGGEVTGTETIEFDIHGFTIDGQDHEPDERYTGLLIRNASGSVNDNVVENMHLGGPETYGMVVYGDSMLDIIDNDISGYQRVGIGANGDFGESPAPDVLIEGNVVTGPGLDELQTGWAPNGIQIGWGATGSVVDNVVMGNSHDTSTPGGVLAVAVSDVLIEDNVITDNDEGVQIYGDFFFDSDLLSDNITVRNNVIGASTYGVGVGGMTANIEVTGNEFDASSIGLDTWTGGDEIDGLVVDGNVFEDNEIQVNDAAEVLDLDTVLDTNAFARGTVVRENPIVVPVIFSGIQAAIDAADDGDLIEVLPGTYAEALFIDKDLTIRSTDGAGTTILDAGGEINAVSIGDVEGSFDADDGIHPDFVRFEGVTVIGWLERGIAQRLGTGTVEIIDNVVDATEGDTRAAILIAGGQDSIVAGNQVSGTAFSGGGASSAGILAVGSIDARVEDNTTSGTDFGIGVAAGFPSIDPGWETAQGVEIVANTVSDSLAGIGLSGNVVDTLIEANQISDIAGRAISHGEFDTSGDLPADVAIINNVATDFGTRAFSPGTLPVTGLEIRDNEFYSTVEGSWGIQVGGGSSDVLIEGNMVSVDVAALNLRSLANGQILANSLDAQAAGVVIRHSGHAGNELNDNDITGGVWLIDEANTDGYVLRDNQLLGATGDSGVVIDDADAGSGPLDAICNYWGHPSGPAGEGGGQGTSVSGSVEFEPWNTAPEGPCDGAESEATSIVAASSQSIAGVAGEPVASGDLPAVQVLDQYDLPVEGVTVGFELASGEGSLTGGTQVSDGDGMAQVGGWTLGGSPGIQTLAATAPGLQGSPVAFEADVDPAADLSISIDDHRSDIDVGENNTYLVVVSNAGPSPVDGADVSVELPPELDAAEATWVCVPGPDAGCSPSGNGDIADGVDLPAGGTVTYQLEAEVLPGPTLLLEVTATVTPPAGVFDPDPDNQSDSAVTEINPATDEIFGDRFEEE